MSIKNPAPLSSSIAEEASGYTKIGVRAIPSSDFDYSGVAIAVYTELGTLISWKKETRSISDQNFLVMENLSPSTTYLVKVASLDDFIYSDDQLILEGLNGALGLLNFEAKYITTRVAPTIVELTNTIVKGPFDATNGQLISTGDADVIKIEDELSNILYDGEYQETVNFNVELGSRSITVTYYSLGELGSDTIAYTQTLEVLYEGSGYLEDIDLKFGDIGPTRYEVDEILEEVSQDIIEIFQRRDDISTEERKRRQQINELSVTIDGELTAVNTRVSEVEVDVTGNTSAIEGLQLSVSNLNTGLSGTIDRVDAVELTNSQQATAISLLQGKVDDPENNTSALYQTIQAAQTTADGNAESITTILSGVTGEGIEADALLKLEAYFTEGGLGARAFLGTNVNNQITGVIVNDDGTERTIEFVSDSVRFVDGSGNLKIYYDLNAGAYVFDGKIIGRSGEFTGKITSTSGSIGGWDITSNTIASSLSSSANRIVLTASSGTISIINSSGVTVGTWSPTLFKAGTGNDYVQWTSAGGLVVSGTITGSTFTGGSINIGSGTFTVNSSGVLTANSANLVGGLKTASGTGNRVEIGTDSTYDIWVGSGAKTDGNGTFWIKANGSGYIARGFLTGKSSEAVSASGTASASVSHVSEGNPVQINYSASSVGWLSGDQRNSTHNISIEVRRGSTVLRSQTIEGAAGMYDQELNRTRIVINGGGTTTDTLTSSGTRTYSVVMTSYNGLLIESTYISTYETY